MTEAAAPIRVVISDDHPVVLMGLKAMLQGRQDHLRLVGEAGSGRELLALLSRQACDLLITDFSMPDEGGSEDGLRLLRRLRRSHPDLSIIVLTMVRNPALVRGMFAAGANGVVGKTAMARELLLALQAVMSGRTYLSEDMHDLGDSTLPVEEPGEETPAASPKGSMAALSPREAEVVRMYAGGLTVTQIARRLRRSVKTVSQQKNDAMRKLGLTSNTQLYEFARNCGLLT